MFARLNLPLLALAAALSSSEGLAQSPPASAFVAPPTVAGEARRVQGAEEPDESALRYYASLKQKARVEAETRRLSRLHPGWTVPDDLYAAPQGAADEGPLWELFGADRLDELQAAIAARQASSPGWRPSDDLARKLRQKDLRRTIMAAAKDGAWQNVADLARFEGLAMARDIELLWTVADAYGRTNRAAEAFTLYQAILQTSDAAPQRLATIQKALAALRLAEAERLIAMGRTGENGRGEFEPIQTDITRARISGYLHDERQAEIPAPELAAFQDYAARAGDPDQAGLVAWYHFKRRDHGQALEWFKTALARGGDAQVAHGLAHTLRMLGKVREAEEVAYAWREPLVNNAILFIDLLETALTQPIPPFIEPERIARYAQVTLATGSGEGAQALGWYAYNSCQFDAALDWFGRAVAWFPKEATAYGYALTLRRLGRQREFLEVVNRYDGLFPKVVELVFPDGGEPPPTPCDPRSARAVQPGPETPMGRPVGVVQDPQRQHRWGRVPNPLQAAAPSGQEAARRRGEFPLSVAMENPLRFGQHSGAQPVAIGGRAPSREAGPGLVARRVPGVGAMPYERLGYSLLPGWNGVDRPTIPSAAEQTPPIGTVWAEQAAAAPPVPLAPAATGPGPGASRPTMPSPASAALRQP